MFVMEVNDVDELFAGVVGILPSHVEAEQSSCCPTVSQQLPCESLSHSISTSCLMSFFPFPKPYPANHSFISG